MSIAIDFSKIYRPPGSALFYYSCSTSNILGKWKGLFFYTDRAKEIIQRRFRRSVYCGLFLQAVIIRKWISSNFVLLGGDVQL